MCDPLLFRDLRDGVTDLPTVRREGQLALAQDTVAVTAILQVGGGGAAGLGEGWVRGVWAALHVAAGVGDWGTATGCHHLHHD